MYALVEFYILVAHQKGIVHAKASENISSVTTKRDGVGLNYTVRARTESGIAHAEFVA